MMKRTKRSSSGAGSFGKSRGGRSGGFRGRESFEKREGRERRDRDHSSEERRPRRERSEEGRFDRRDRDDRRGSEPRFGRGGERRDEFRSHRAAPRRFDEDGGRSERRGDFRGERRAPRSEEFGQREFRRDREERREFPREDRPFRRREGDREERRTPRFSSDRGRPSFERRERPERRDRDRDERPRSRGGEVQKFPPLPKDFHGRRAVGITEPMTATPHREERPVRSKGEMRAMQEDVRFIVENFGYEFTDTALLERALTHRSVQFPGHETHYERLEFLGDAVVDLVTAHLLLEQRPDAQEGELTKLRASLVNEAQLSEIAREIELGGHIKLSAGELAAGGPQKSSILADVMEALLGAIYFEGGYQEAFAAVEKLYGDKITQAQYFDPKTELQEELARQGKAAPEYFVESREGSEHEPTFVSIVKVDGEILGRGRGNSKRASQQEAARIALQTLLPEDDSVEDEPQGDEPLAEELAVQPEETH